MTLTPDERHAVAGELRWLARRREQHAVMSPEWLRQRADWIEVSGERRAPERERDEQRRADALDSIVLRWGEPR